MNKEKKKSMSIIGQTIQESIDSLENPPTQQEENGKYQAFKRGREIKSETMLEINASGDTSFLIYYFDIRKIEFEGNRLISIITSQDIITIEGKNLSTVKNLFRENRIISVNEFDPMKYVSAGEEGEAFIEAIEVEAVSVKLDTA